MKPRLGAIRYLNALPLVNGLDRDPDLGEVRFAAPSTLAGELRSGRLDLALVPQVEGCRSPDYRVVPGICVACRGPVESILLFRNRPWEDIHTVGVDPSSNSSVELLKVLFRRRLGRVPHCIPVPPDLSRLRAPSRPEPDVDAVLLIGDAALREDRGEFERDDLGEVWWNDTRRPFVFAVWLGRESSGKGAVSAVQRACERGLANRAALVERFCREQPGIDFDRALRYISEVIHYSLGAEEIDSMKMFHRLRVEMGLVPPDTWQPQFFESGASEGQAVS